MAAKYASTTTVTPEKTRMEIELLLMKYSASAYVYGMMPDRAAIQFEMKGRRYRINLMMPKARDFRTTALHNQAIRQTWRALLLVLKAKLVAVEQGIAMLEQEFLAYLVLPSGETAGEWMIPQIAESYATQQMPALLPAPRGE